MKTLTRALHFDRAAINASTRTVAATLSSELPVARDFGDEVLLHTPEAVDMTRAVNGLPLLFSHKRDQIVGRVEDIRLDKNKLRGLLRFSENTQANEVWRDVEAGILTDLSIGYKIEDMALDPAGAAWLATRWQPLEVSVVTIGADPSAGIGRSAPNSENIPKEQPDMQLNHQAVRSIVQLGRFDDQTTERMTLDCLASGMNEQEVGQAVQRKKAEIQEADFAIMPPMHDRSFSHTPTRAALMAEALAARWGGPAPSEAAREYVNKKPVDMARDLLEARGIRTNRLSAGEVIGRAMTTTSDFPNLLANSGNRTLQAAYQSYGGGLKRICRPSTIADFRAKQVLKLGEAPALNKVNEHGEYTYGSPIESKESYSLYTFGRIFAITRQALINDDLGAFGNLIAKFGIAAAEREAQQLATLLTSNPTMADGVALFHANHGNLAGSAAAISVTSLGLARKAMRLQTGLDGTTAIDCSPAFLIVPAALETVAEQFLATLSPTVSTDVNPFSGKLELVVDPRLDASSATAWYLAARPELIDTIEYAYLEGYNGPTIEVREGFEVDGTEFKARLDFGCGVLDHRGLFKNAGA